MPHSLLATYIQNIHRTLTKWDKFYCMTLHGGYKLVTTTERLISLNPVGNTAPLSNISDQRRRLSLSISLPRFRILFLSWNRSVSIFIWILIVSNFESHWSKCLDIITLWIVLAAGLIRERMFWKNLSLFLLTMSSCLLWMFSSPCFHCIYALISNAMNTKTKFL